MSERVLHGDCLKVLATLDECSLDSCVTDPPYGLRFMGKDWDHGVPGVPFWSAVLRVLKPGARLCAFGGTRTYHRLACAIEDAGFEIRDTLAWMYGQGFPKSLDVSKAIDKAAGAQRQKVRVYARNPRVIGGGRDGVKGGTRPYIMRALSGDGYTETEGSEPVTDEAKKWDGWGTGLKPAYEPIILARKPIVGTVAANVLAHMTGALNVDACRIGMEKRVNQPMGAPENSYGGYGGTATATVGRWPANVLLGHHEKCVEPGGCRTETWLNCHGNSEGRMIREPLGWCHHDCAVRMLDAQSVELQGYLTSGGASRFFYTAKAGKREREGSKHQTVKPLDLMRWLVRLVTQPGGTVLDPFAGTGTTGEAALMEGFACVLIEREAEYVADIEKRLRETQLGLGL